MNRKLEPYPEVLPPLPQPYISYCGMFPRRV